MDTIKFLRGGYWNDFDSNAVGGRSTLVFCWAMIAFLLFCLSLPFIYPVTCP